MRRLALVLLAGSLLGGCCFQPEAEDACLLGQGTACVPIHGSLPVCFGEDEPSPPVEDYTCPGELRPRTTCAELGFTTQCGSYLVAAGESC